MILFPEKCKVQGRPLTVFLVPVKLFFPFYWCWNKQGYFKSIVWFHHYNGIFQHPKALKLSSAEDTPIQSLHGVKIIQRISNIHINLIPINIFYPSSDLQIFWSRQFCTSLMPILEENPLFVKSTGQDTNFALFNNWKT